MFYSCQTQVCMALILFQLLCGSDGTISNSVESEFTKVMLLIGVGQATLSRVKLNGQECLVLEQGTRNVISGIKNGSSIFP